MADIANLGFRADTSDLADAKVKLQALAPAADKAERSADKLGQTLGQTGAKANAAAAGLIGAGNAANAAAAGLNSETAAANNASAAIGRKVSWLGRLIASLRGVKPAADAAAMGVRQVTVAANDNAGAMKANVGNIAAQFQDIGVTAAMGMSPMMIAMQQGTQLAAVFAASNQSAFKTLAGAVMSVISPTAILTIGLVALAAAGLQMVDWVNLAKSALNGLADIMEKAAPYAVYLGVVMALAFAPQILSAVLTLISYIGVSLVNAVVAATGAMLAFAAANPFGALVIAIGLVVAAAWAFDDELTKILGFSVLEKVKKAANYIIGSFVAAFHDIQFVWNNLPAVVGAAAIGATNAVIRSINWLLEKGTAGINALIGFANQALATLGISPIGEVATPQLTELANAAAQGLTGAVAARNAQLQKDLSKDYISAIGGAIGDAAKWASGKLRGFASGLGADDKKKDKPEKAATGKTDAEKFGDITNRADQTIATMKAERDAVNMTAEAAARLKYETQLLNQAQQAGITLTPQQTAKLKELAGVMADLEIQTADAKAFKAATAAGANRIVALEQERAAIGLTADEAIRYKNEIVWLNQQLETMVNATPAQIEALRAQAQGMSEIEIATRKANEEIKKQQEAYDFAKGVFKGFFTEMKSGLQQGKSLWASFADALGSAVDKILDRLLDLALDAAFQALTGGPGGMDFSFLGFAKGGSFMPDNRGAPRSTGTSNSKWKFTSSAPTMYASGGIFDKPTAFAFGKGGANLGIMGEAGPEAVMPLQRGPDGSLGVQMYGAQSSGGAPTYVTVAVDARTTLTGAVSSKDIVALNEQQAMKTKQEIAREVPQIIERYQRNGTTV